MAVYKRKEEEFDSLLRRFRRQVNDFRYFS